MLPAAARGHLSRTQPGPQHFLHARAGRGSKRPAGLDARQTHCTLADSPAPVIRHCTEMTQQSACPPKGTTAPQESLLRHGDLGEVPHPERTSRSILHPSNESPTGPRPCARPRAQLWGPKCERGSRAGPGDREARARLALSLVAFTWENQALLPLTGENSDAWGLRTLPPSSVHGPQAESMPLVLMMGDACGMRVAGAPSRRDQSLESRSQQPGPQANPARDQASSLHF